MSKGKQLMLSRDPYERIRTDRWINIGIVLTLVGGGLMFILAVLQWPSLMWLGVSTLIVCGALSWWQAFRRMAWSMRRSREQQRRDTLATRIGRFLLGIGLILIGGLVHIGLDSLHQSWAYLIDSVWSALIVAGVVLIVQAVKSQIERDK